MNILSIIFSSFRYRPLPTLLNIFAVTVGTALVIALLIIHSGLNRGVIEQGSRYDIIVGAEGSPTQLLLSTLFHYEQPIGNISHDLYLEAKNSPKVNGAIPLALGDNYAGFRIVGTTLNYLEHHNFIENKDQFTWEGGEAIIGSEAARRTGLVPGDVFRGTHGIAPGDEDHLHDYEYTVIGILDETGGGDDLYIFTPVESVWHAHEDQDCDHDDHHDHNDRHHHDDHVDEDDHHDHVDEDDHHDHVDEDDHHDHNDRHHHDDHSHHHDHREVTALLLQVDGLMNQIEIKEQFDGKDGVQVIHTTEILRQLLNTMGNGAVVANLLAYTALLLAGVSILISLLASVAERRRDAAIYRVLGARKGTILKAVILEAFTLTLAGVVTGVITAHAASHFLAGWITDTAGVRINPMQLAPGEVTAVLTILALGVIVGLISGLSIYRTQPTSYLD